MFFFRRNVINNKTVTSRTQKIVKQINRDAKKQIKRGTLTSNHKFAMYLETIDARFVPIRADIASATVASDTSKERAALIAETRQLLDFFQQDQDTHARLLAMVQKKAKDAGRTEDLEQEQLSTIDISKLKSKFNKLDDSANDTPMQVGQLHKRANQAPRGSMPPELVRQRVKTQNNLTNREEIRNV